MTKPRYLTAQKVAEYFECSVKTIYRWIETGYIREYTRIGNGIRIPEHEVDRLVEEGKNKDISDLIAPARKPRQGGGWVNQWKK